jgi:hypothetical protein
MTAISRPLGAMPDLGSQPLYLELSQRSLGRLADTNESWMRDWLTG